MKLHAKVIATLSLIAFALAIVGVLLPGCATGTKPTAAQVAQGTTTALQIAALAFDTYAQAKGGHLTTAQIAALAQNDLNGAAVIAQAYSGTNANAAALATGASQAALMAGVVAQLPPDTFTGKGTIDQTTADVLFKAAASIPQVTATRQ